MMHFLKSLNIRNESFDVIDNLKKSVYLLMVPHELFLYLVPFLCGSSIGYKHKGFYHTKGLMMQLLLFPHGAFTFHQCKAMTLI